jgi:hypothetical protein
MTVILDPLVKLYLMVNGKRLKKKKTECRKGTCHPVWNQALTFTLPSTKLHSCTLEVNFHFFLNSKSIFIQNIFILFLFRYRWLITAANAVVKVPNWAVWLWGRIRTRRHLSANIGRTWLTT